MTINSTVNRGSWLCYFNGVETPCISASVNAGVAQISQASVTLPPDVSMRRIGAEDRVRMTLFYLDQYRNIVEGDEPQWRLLFDGEIVSYQYTNAPGGRSLSYTAVDMLEALGRVFAFFATDLLTSAEAQVSTNNNTVTVKLDPLAPMASLFSVGLAKGNKIKRPFEFVENILNLLVDPDTGIASQRSVIAKNWFEQWNERVKFSDRFVPSFGIEQYSPPGTTQTPGIFPLFRAAQEEQAVTALQGLGNDVVNNQSFYALIQTIFQHVYYELHSNITPPYVKVNTKTKDIVGTPNEALAQDAGLESPVTGEEKNVIATYMTKPQTLFGIPPNCNVFWPSQVRQFSFNENFAMQPTRTYVGNLHLYNVMTGKKSRRVGPGQQGIKMTAVRALTSGYPPIADDNLDVKHSKQGEPTNNHHNFLVFPEEYFKGPVYYNHNMPAIFTYLAKHQQDKTKELSRLYAKYEHFRQRYAQRNGGISMDFNPYALHGFSCVYIDNEESNHHCFGYVTQVTHSLGQDDMSTSVAFTYGQTFDEFFESVTEDLSEFGLFGSDTSGEALTREQAVFTPANPIQTIRDQFQIFPAAEEYYRTMFHRTETWGQNPVAFNYMDVFAVENEDSGAVSDISLVVGDGASNVTTDEETGRTPKFVVKEDAKLFTVNSELAFAYASRPVTTLDEWIDAQGELGFRLTEIPANAPRQGKGAPYWVEILQLIQGPGQEPRKDTEGNPCDATEVDTRKNWRDRILRFRQKVYLDNHHHRA